MKTAKELTEKAAELGARLAAKAEDLTSLMLEGKDTSKLLDEIARLETETGSTKAAAAIAERREAEQAAADRLALLADVTKKVEAAGAKADKQAGDILDIVLKVGSLINDLAATVEEADSLAGRYELKTGKLADSRAVVYTQPLAQAIGAVSNALDFQKNYGGDAFTKKYAEPFRKLQERMSPPPPWSEIAPTIPNQVVTKKPARKPEPVSDADRARRVANQAAWALVARQREEQ